MKNLRLPFVVLGVPDGSLSNSSIGCSALLDNLNRDDLYDLNRIEELKQIGLVEVSLGLRCDRSGWQLESGRDKPVLPGSGAIGTWVWLELLLLRVRPWPKD